MIEDNLESIDTNSIPKMKLQNGAEIPVIGMGTFGSDHIDSESVAEAVRFAH